MDSLPKHPVLSQSLHPLIIAMSLVLAGCASKPSEPLVVVEEIMPMAAAGEMEAVSEPTEIVEQRLDLSQAIRVAANRNPVLASAKLTAAQAQVGTDVARSAYFPRLSVGAGAGDRDSRGENVTVNVSQLLFDFGRTGNAVDAADARNDQQLATSLQQLDLVSRRVAEAVIRTHLFQRLAEVSLEQLNVLQDVQNLVRQRVNAGLSSEVDAIQAKARVDAAKAVRNQILAQQARSRQSLRALLGAGLATQTVYLEEPLSAESRINLNETVDAANSLQVAKAGHEVAKAELRQAKSQRWPTLSLDAAMDRELRRREPSLIGDENDLIWRLNLAWSLQGNLANQQVRAASFAEQAAAMQVEAARLDIDEASTGTRALLQGDRLRLESLEVRQGSIEQVRTLYREQYKVGVRSILDLLNAEQELFQARNDYESAKHDYWLNLVGYVAETSQTLNFYELQLEVPAKDIRK